MNGAGCIFFALVAYGLGLAVGYCVGWTRARAAIAKATGSQHG